MNARRSLALWRDFVRTVPGLYRACDTVGVRPRYRRHGLSRLWAAVDLAWIAVQRRPDDGGRA